MDCAGVRGNLPRKWECSLMFGILTVVEISWVYVSVKMNGIVHFKWIHLLYANYVSI